LVALLGRFEHVHVVVDIIQIDVFFNDRVHLSQILSLCHKFLLLAAGVLVHILLAFALAVMIWPLSSKIAVGILLSHYEILSEQFLDLQLVFCYQGFDLLLVTQPVIVVLLWVHRRC